MTGVEAFRPQPCANLLAYVQPKFTYPAPCYRGAREQPRCEAWFEHQLMLVHRCAADLTLVRL